MKARSAAKAPVVNDTARYDVMGPGHDAYRDLLAALGGPCVPQLVGWCELEVDGAIRTALVVTQAWPLGLPFGTEPRPIMKAQRYAAVMPDGQGFRIEPVAKPPAVLAADRHEIRVRDRMEATGESFTTAARRLQPELEECPTCLGHRQIPDGETGELRKCLDCNGLGMQRTGQVMTSRRLTQVQAVELLAKEHGVTLKPAGGRTFDVLLPDMQLRVEITMKVHHEARRDEQASYRETALERIADPDRGVWTDSCDTSVKERGSFMSNKTTGCKKPVIGVVVRKHFENVFYSFRCHCHIDRPDLDPTKVVHREVMRAELGVARRKRAAAIALRERMAKMSPAELVEHDALEIGRKDLAMEIRQNMESEPTAAALRGDPEYWMDHAYRVDSTSIHG